jgi:signal transduction histidine kinase/CheY-like chemotaxis protein
MANSQTTLEEFVLSIPICYRNSTWESWISTMYESTLGMIALISNDGIPQGLLENHSLLGLIAQKIANEPELEATNFLERSLDQIIVPPIILPSHMKVETFLARHHQELKHNYLIVDRVDKLLGILDFSKLLQNLYCDRFLQPKTPSANYQKKAFSRNKLLAQQQNIVNIVSESYYSPTDKATKIEITEKSSEEEPKKVTKNEIDLENLISNQTEFNSLNPILSHCLTQIAVPLKIENARGEICYQNALWHQTTEFKQDLITHVSSVKAVAELKQIYSSTSFLDKSKSINLQATKLAPNQNINLNSYHCATVNNSEVIASVSNHVKTQVKQLDSFLANAEEQLLTTNFSEGEAQANTKERSVLWHYYQLPLAIDRDCLKITDSANYWLIFATRVPLQESLIVDLEQQKQFSLKQLQDELLLNISHDIKSPLTAIIGLSSLLKEEKLGTLNSSQVRYSEMIYYSGKRLINLINDFLEITNLTTKKLQFKFEPLELENTCQQIYHQVTQKFIALAAIKQKESPSFPELQLDVTLGTKTVVVDKAYFCQILTRLVDNALNLTSSDELLGISAEYWSDWLAVTVWNEGGGFSEAQQNILTTESSQYANLLTSQAKNQELGLILAQQLAQAHGGDISFISQSNYGSEFTLLLPLQPNRENLAVDPFTLQPNFQPKPDNSLILIVETASKRIIDLSEKLKTLGYHCAIARNESEALYKARCLKPWKILLNSSFVESSTNNLVKMYKSDPQTDRIPLFLIRETTSPCNFEGYLHHLVAEILNFPLSRATLTKFFPPIVPCEGSSSGKTPRVYEPRQSLLTQNLTVLRLSLKGEINQVQENLALDFVFENPSFSLCHHIIEADNLEQANLLAEIWNIDVIIWDGITLESPEKYLQSLARLDVLASIPMITLDARTTAAANQISNLVVFPCLLPANERSIQQLTQVIQIAAGFA